MASRGRRIIKGVAFFVALVVTSVLIGIVLVQFEPDQTNVAEHTTTPSVPTVSPTVPNVVGIRVDRAKADINMSGLEPRVSYDWSKTSKGTVIRQKPAGRASADEGTKVTLVVSKGMPVVPRWKSNGILGLGLTPLRTAKRKLAALDLKIGRVVYQVYPPSWLHAGEVFGSSPDPGTSVRPGKRVTLYVTKLASCTPGYSPCLPPHTVLGAPADYDCAGGTGDGPYYVYGTVRVTGTDPYDLDGDNNGWGC